MHRSLSQRGWLRSCIVTFVRFLAFGVILLVARAKQLYEVREDRLRIIASQQKTQKTNQQQQQQQTEIEKKKKRKIPHINKMRAC